MYLLKEEQKNIEILAESSADRSLGLAEGRGLCKKIIEKSKTGNVYDVTVIRDFLVGVLDGFNMQIIQLTSKDKSPVLSKISMALDDAFTEISRVK